MTTLFGRISNNEDPMTTSVRGMTMQIHLMTFPADNIAGADTPGYQKKVPVVTTFAEHLGMNGVDTVTDTSVGRIHNTLRPLDLALTTKGYFQKRQADGRVELTRDGRMKLDKDGALLSDDGLPILSRQGTPLRMPFIPETLNHIKVATDGTVEILDPKSGVTKTVGQIGIATQTGAPAEDIDVRQGFAEASNVFLHEEFVAMVGPRRSFQANRQIFLTQSSILSRMIQELGRAQ